MNITEKIKQIKQLRVQKNHAIRLEYENTRPMKNDLGDIERLYEVFKTIAKKGYEYNDRIFVLLIFFMYSPISFGGMRMFRSGLRSKLAKVMGTTNRSITNYFGDAKSLIINHKGFREETERIYDALSTEV